MVPGSTRHYERSGKTPFILSGAPMRWILFVSPKGLKRQNRKAEYYGRPLKSGIVDIVIQLLDNPCAMWALPVSIAPIKDSEKALRHLDYGNPRLTSNIPEFLKIWIEKDKKPNYETAVSDLVIVGKGVLAGWRIWTEAGSLSLFTPPWVFSVTFFDNITTIYKAAFVW